MPNPKATSFADDLAALTPQEGNSFASDLAGTAPKSTPGTSGALAVAAIKAAVPGLSNAVQAFATSPTVPKTGATIGKMLGGIAPIVGGATEGGVTGGLAGVAAASKGAWAGGKTGWFTGKLAQQVAMPVAKGLEAAAPYAQALSTLSGAQGLGDLAQIAEPTRTDIGFLGVGKTQHVPGQEPALLNLLAQKLSDAVSYLMGQGMSQGEAVKTVMNLKVKAGR